VWVLDDCYVVMGALMLFNYLVLFCGMVGVGVSCVIDCVVFYCCEIIFIFLLFYCLFYCCSVGLLLFCIGCWLRDLLLTSIRFIFIYLLSC